MLSEIDFEDDYDPQPIRRCAHCGRHGHEAPACRQLEIDTVFAPQHKRSIVVERLRRRVIKTPRGPILAVRGRWRV